MSQKKQLYTLFPKLVIPQLILNFKDISQLYILSNLFILYTKKRALFHEFY